MKKIVTVIGARPQFIKMALISAELETKKIKEVVIHTGQHYDKRLSGIFFKELKISRPNYNLGIGSGFHGEQTAGMMRGIERILIREKPDIVLIYGDTNSTLAAALAASKLNIKVAHVEAGLRSFNKSMPEEINRIVADSVSTLLFCPTKTAAGNLKKEGIRNGIYIVGDVMYDSIKSRMGDIGPSIERSPYILCTIHRAENTDQAGRLREIFKSLGALKTKVVVPIHPRTAKYLKRYGVAASDNIKIVEPVGYLKMLNLERYAELIITDSGGVQKEAFIFGVPCVTIRGQTEWVESVRSGMNTVVKAKREDILAAVKKMRMLKKRAISDNQYGDGRAYKKIVNILITYLKEDR